MTTGGKPPGLSPVAFTIRYQGRSLRLTSEVQIFPAFLPPSPTPAAKTYTALYDTGATHSAISPRVVSDLQLASIAAMNVGVGGGVPPQLEMEKAFRR
jgi:hypothetical protein